MARQLNIRLDSPAVFMTWGDKPYPLGTRGHAPDGRAFRLARAGGTALSIGRTAQAALPDPRMRNIGTAGEFDGRTNVLTLRVGNLVNALESGATAAGEYDDGLLYVVSGAGAGHVYRISSSEAGDPANGRLEIALDTHQSGALGFNGIRTSTRVTLFRNRFRNLAIADSPPKTAVAGATPEDISANLYFWLQTHGACAIMQEGQTEAYRPVAASKVTQGAVHLATTTVPDPDTVGRQHYNTDGLAVVSVIRPGDTDAERLAPVSGVGVVPDVQLGYVLDEGADGAFALVHLTVEV